MTSSSAEATAQQEAQARTEAWAAALQKRQLPPFVQARLDQAHKGQTPWLSTMSPAELLLARSHGMRPVAMVSGTCWYQYGRSWTEGHAAGWAAALERIRLEAQACGANAVVDVRMRTIAGHGDQSMDFTLIGTAIKVAGLPPSTQPIVATVPALEFVRLLQLGITPAGIAVGARFDWLTDNLGAMAGGLTWGNQQLGTLSIFWESIRRSAHRDLRISAAAQGNGVLADVHFGQLLQIEGERQPTRYLARHIVIGTVVDTPPGLTVGLPITRVVDMRDELSPLDRGAARRTSVYDLNEQEGGL